VLASADAELRTTFTELVDRRRADPGSDLVSALVAEQGKEITAAELSALVRLLLIAGFETTVNAIGNGMRWLLADREQWELLVKDPGLAPTVVEEVLRFDPPVQQTARVARRPTEVGDVLVGTNQWVITLLAAANRDPDVYPEPNRFDISRESPVEHLAFSGGIHYCLGSPLARLELTQAFRALAVRFPRIRQTAPITMRPGTTLRGPFRFPVAVS
jgi:cytochrome P450